MTLLRILCFAALAAAADDLPRIDLHIHTHEEESSKIVAPADAAALSRKMGVRFGIVAEGGCRGDIHGDQTLAAFVRGLEGLPLYRGLQVYGFDWPRCLSKANRDRLDFIAADALVFPDNGKSVWLWLPDVKFADAEDFMERYVAFNLRVLSQPIQVWSNATFLPESLQSRYDALWTAERMDRVINQAVENGIAIEINSRYRIPSAAFIWRAKAAGAKFTFGSNSHAKGMGEIEYSLRTARECGLTRKHIWTPARRLD